MNCHSFKKRYDYFGNNLLNGLLYKLTLQAYRELLELVSRDQ